MQIKTKVLVASCLCLVGLGGFLVSTGGGDRDGIIENYKATTDGSYYKKYITITKDVEVGASGEEVTTTTISADVPADTDVAKWQAYITASEMSDARHAIVLEALDTVQKHCIYHQLRSGNGTATRCIVVQSGGKCDSETVGSSYNYGTQAAYNIEDPVYLDCSFFVKHCYWKGGYEMAVSNTSGMYEETDFKKISKEEMVPGDIGVKNGHTKLFVGLDSNGQMVWAEMASHNSDSVLSVGDLPADYKYKRFGALANDTKFVGGKSTTTTGGATSTAQPGTQQITWSDSWEFADLQMVHPDSLNKYVPDNYNGHTVFVNPGHGNGQDLASVIPNDPFKLLQNQYKSASSAGHTSGTSYTTSAGKTVSEAQYVLDVSNKTKVLLLAKGYAVVMARESLVNNFENAARSVWANNVADIHVAVHIDAGTHGPGWYRPSVAQKAHSNYAKNISADEKLGTSIEESCSAILGKPTYKNMAGVLTGYSYSTIPCVYIELMGVESKDMADFADTHIDQCAQGIVDGIDKYFN